MKPVTFPEVNAIYAKYQPEYTPLPVFRADTIVGEVVSCHQLTIRERIRVLFEGKIWLCMLTFRAALQPILLSANKNEIFTSGLVKSRMSAILKALPKHGSREISLSERFKKPTHKQIIDMAIIFNDGKIEPMENLVNMVAMCEVILDRLYENGDITMQTKKEREEEPGNVN